MKVEFQDDSLPKGTEVHINDLGTLVNGKAVEFDDERVNEFEARTGKTVADALAGDGRIKLSGSGARTITSDKEEGGDN